MGMATEQALHSHVQPNKSELMALAGVAFALSILSLVFKLVILQYASLVVLFLILLSNRVTSVIAAIWLFIVSRIGMTLFQALLVLVFYLFITLYAFLFHSKVAYKFSAYRNRTETNYIDATRTFEKVDFERLW